MHRKLTSFFASLIAVAASASEVADSVMPIISRISEAQSQVWRMTPEAFSNPALRQWMLPVSISAIEASYSSDRLNSAIDPRSGKGSTGWKLGAESFIHHRSSTLWGSAFYSNGRQLSPVWNESSDLSMIYPYVTADSIGGDIKSESYALAGGYADHSENWAWGASLSYIAGLNYRSVDPRPRNVTGRLTISAGAAWQIPLSAYLLGTSLEYMRYKQSADISYVNELADTRIWHLTGLGTHYQRFAGQGYSHSYQGNRLSASLNLFPKPKRGLSVSARFTRFAFDHLLTGLNNMPLQSAVDTRWDFEAAWLHRGSRHELAATATLSFANRQGKENIFGDPAAGIYPRIGSMPMYHHRMTEASIRLLWQYRPTLRTLFRIEPRATFSRSRQTYADPWRLMQLSCIDPGVEAAVCQRCSPHWSVEAAMTADYSIPAGCRLDLTIDPRDPLGMQQAEIRSYEILSRNHMTGGVRVNATRALSSRYAIMLAARYDHSRYARSVSSNSISASLSFIF